ncbi:MAG: tRNA preQ1(34) S-adenosylmethionine ribosyltransferase-isomerase QueA [Alphaproteobacteria bacterium]|nr:MAG: tRNA preQ1(34) S-adenosylmethionine ribosyltransferase-isomerase QueA [Alphaproteobacteria bacterium]
MRTDLFDFPLPPDRIALRPVRPRDAARLLAVRPDGVLEDRAIRDLPELLQPGDQLVVNDTRVVPASLSGRRIGRGPETRIEANLVKRLDGSRWQAFVKPAKRLAAGDVVRFGDEGKVCFLGQLDATVEAKGEGGEVTFAFAFHGPVLDQAIAERGEMPLPPYIASRRAPDDEDRADYQTLFAHNEGSVAAPTAGLHFTEQLVSRLKARGIGLHTVTLHVGAGTFLPVKAEDTADHKMHAEYGTLTGDTAAALNAARRAGGRIVAVGSTSLRLLESATEESGTIRPFAGETAIFITPGYAFRAVDVMLTNFHLPRSTLFMLVAAFSGLDTMKRAYAHAIEAGYRFYSYGDACLLLRA